MTQAQAAAAPSEAFAVEGRFTGGFPVGLVLVAEPSDRPGATIAARLGANGGFVLLAPQAGDYRLRLVREPLGFTIAEGTLHLEADDSDADRVLTLDLDRTSGRLNARFGLGIHDGPPSNGAEAPPAAALELLPGVNDPTTADGAAGGQPEGGVSAERAPDAAAGLSAAGLSSLWNTPALDGLGTGQSFRGGTRGAALAGPRGQSTFAASAVRALRTTGQPQYSAQTGSAGLALPIESRAAGNKLHASGYLRGQARVLDAANPFAVATAYSNGAVAAATIKPDSRSLLFGGTAAVPLPAFWLGHAGHWAAGLFLSEEAERHTETLVSTPALPDFFSLSATQRALLANRGVSTAAINTALDYLSGLGGPLHTESPRALSFGRLDLASPHGDRIALAYNRQRFRSPSGPGLGSRAEGILNRGRGSLGTAVIHVDALTARWSRPLWRGSLLDVRLGFAHDLERELPAAPLAQEPAIAPGGLAPQVNIAPDGFAYGTPASLGRSRYPDERRLEAAGTLLVRLGSRQALVVGGGWSRVDDRIDNGQNAAGSFSYDSGTTGGRAGGLVDWITDFTFNVNAYPNGGCPSINSSVHDFCFRSFSQSFAAPESEFFTHDSAGFAEDRIRLRANLLLTLGARFDYTFLPLPVVPNPELDATLRELNLANATPQGTNGGLTSVFPEDRNNYGPRAALSWSPGRRWFALHAGYGAFYGRLPGALIDTAFTQTALPASTRTLRITPTTETLCPQVANQGFGYPCVFVAEPTGVAAQTGQAFVFSSRFRLPAIQRASIGLERDLGRLVSLRAGYAVSIATQLPNSVDLNLAPATGTAAFVLQGGAGQPGLKPGETFQVPLYTARLSPSYGPITAITSHANAVAHLGTLEGMLRQRDGFTVHAAYTLMRALDTNPRLGPTAARDTQFDPFAIGYDKGRSSLDFTHRLAGEVTYRSRVEHGALALRLLGDGWQTTALGSVGSGAPYSYNIFGGTYLSGGRESINGSGGATFLPTIGRNTLRLPIRERMDLRVGRSLPLHRSLRMTLEAAAFNLLNSQPVSRVETRAFLLGTPATSGAPTPLVFQDAPTIATEGLTTPAFGSALSSTTALSRERRLELGTRLAF